MDDLCREDGNNAKIYGKSRKRSNGVLKPGRPYLQVPYTLLRARDFLSLDPMASKIFWILVSIWKTHAPDQPVEISFDVIRVKCSQVVGDKIIKPSYRRISEAMKQLIVYGFIHKTVRHKQCNKYWIEQKWFTGEYK